MSVQEFAQQTIEFIRLNEVWAIPIVFLLAFGESLALFALLLPATFILWGVGAVIGASGLSFWPLYFAAALGAALGAACGPAGSWLIGGMAGRAMAAFTAAASSLAEPESIS